MKNVKSPSPLAPRICACGCGHEFQPTRKDKVYLNNDHAQFGYNHGKRKERDGNSSKVNKLIRKNDNILRIFFEQGHLRKRLPRLSSLKDLGFNCGINVANQVIDGKIFLIMYNYRYTLIKRENESYVKIEKI